jgi:hypothetical protein
LSFISSRVYSALLTVCDVRTAVWPRVYDVSLGEWLLSTLPCDTEQAVQTFRRNAAQDGECLVILDCLTIEIEGTRFPLNAVQCLAKNSMSNSTYKLSG